MVYHPVGQEPIAQSLLRGEFIAAPIVNPWLTKARDAGLVLIPEPCDVVMMSRQKTLHRSELPERPEQVTLSTYLRVMVAPSHY
jgi:hypothetical protein